MLAVRNRLRAAETPCAAYNYLHTLVTSAAANFYDGIRTTSIYVETENPAYGDLSIQYFEAGNTDTRLAQAELTSMSRPACQTIVSPAGGDGSVGILAVAAVAIVIAVGLAAAGSALRKRVTRESTRNIGLVPSSIDGLSEHFPVAVEEDDTTSLSSGRPDTTHAGEANLNVTRQEAMAKLTLALYAAKRALKAGRDVSGVRVPVKRARMAFESGDYRAAEAEADSILRALTE